MKMKLVMTLAFMTLGINAALKAADPDQFSLHNKTKGTIYVTIDNDGASKDEMLVAVPKDGFFETDLELGNQTTLTIHGQNRTPTYTAKFPKDVTLYISWDGSKASSSTWTALVNQASIW